MASFQFTDRFKNKTEKLGKTGVSSLLVKNPVETQEIPENKLHSDHPSLFPSLQKVRILKISKPEEKKQEIPALNSTRSLTPAFLPIIRQSPPRFGGPGRNPRDSSETLTSASMLNPSLSSQGKLPNLRRVFYNIHKLLPS